MYEESIVESCMYAVETVDLTRTYVRNNYKGTRISMDAEDNPGGLFLSLYKIANTLYILGYKEKWGIGTLTVIKKCIQNGNDEPTFQTNHTFRAEIKSRYITSTNNREQLIIQYLATKKQATRREIEKLLGLKESTVRKILENMQNKGLITKQGTGKKTTYKLNI